MTSPHSEPSDPATGIPATPPAATVMSLPREQAGAQIGHYKLLQPIGEGGFGSVWMAEQREPVKRRVALKIIKLGMDTRQVIARFEAERQALAIMDHPNIARVLDAGATDTGRPYFVMEYIRGVPILEYCDTEKMDTEGRLDLFVSVCHAIQHAHQKGIIHRDIKPSNVLITLHDGVAVPKVIDFGIAKATSSELTAKTLFTEHRQMIGTPAYMSPEQAEMSGLDIDTRSDIYSLGVLLYEMLTGTTPFATEELMSKGFAEMMRIIRDVEPHKPSTRLGSLGDTGARTAEQRHAGDAKKLGLILRGDLDWIVMKCLEKDRTRRYETANGLAADIRRHQNDEPVTASPPSTNYRLRKFVKRNRAGVIAGSLVGCTLVLGIAGTSLGLAWALRQKTRAESAEQGATAARAATTEQRDLAQDRLYESLVREARAIRTNRQVGYRQDCIDRLRQAAAIPTPKRDIEVLEAEASRCLGDPVGVNPVEFAGDWRGSPPGQPDAPSHAIHPWGTVVARGSQDGKLSLYDAETGALTTTLEDQGPIAKLAFGASTMRLFGVVMPQSGEGKPPEPSLVEWRRAGPGGWTRHSARVMPGLMLVNSPSAVVVVTSSQAGVFELTDLEADKQIGNVPLQPLALSADRRLAALRGDDSVAVIVRDMDKGETRARLEPRLGFISGAFFNDDGSYLAVANETGITVYDTQRFERVSGYRGYYQTPSFLDRTTLVIPLPQEGTVRFLNVASNSDVSRLTMGSWDVQVAAESRTVLAIGRKTQVVQLGDTPERRRLLGHAGGVPAVEFSPDGKQIASIGKDATIRFWDAATGNQVNAWTGLDGPGQAVAYSPDGRTIVSTEWNGNKVRLWSVATGRTVLTLGGEPDSGTTYSAGFSPTGRHLAATGSYGLSVWELEPSGDGAGYSIKASLVRQVRGEGVWAHHFDGGSEQLCYTVSAANSAATYVLGLNGDASQPRLVLNWGTTIQGLGLASRDDSFVSMNRKERALEFWKVESPANSRVVPTRIAGDAATGGMANLRVSPDGATVAALDTSGRGVNIIDIIQGRRLYTLPEEHGSVWWLAWSPDSTHLAVSRSEGDISIWDLSKARAVLAEANLSPGAAESGAAR